MADDKVKYTDWIAGVWLISSHGRSAGWEKYGPAPCDGAEPIFSDRLPRHADSSAPLADAVTTLHAQQTADGRPRCFIPQLETDEA